MLSSSVSVDIDIGGIIISFPMAESTVMAALAARCLGYTYHLAVYENFDLRGILYPQHPLYNTVYAAAETESVAALASFYKEEVHVSFQ